MRFLAILADLCMEKAIVSTSKSFHIRYYRHGKIVLVRVEGPVTYGTAPGLLRPVLSLFKKGVHDVVVDLSLTPEIDEHGLEALQEISAVLENVGRPPLIVVAPVRTQPERFLEKHGPFSDLRIFHSTDEAYQAENAPIPQGEAVRADDADLYITWKRIERDDVLVYEIEGELDVEEVRRVKDRLLGEVESGNHKLVIDLSAVDFIDSSALGLFVSLKNKLAPIQGDLRFSRLSPQVRRVFEVFRLPQLYGIYESIDDAVASFQSGA